MNSPPRVFHLAVSGRSATLTYPIIITQVKYTRWAHPKKKGIFMPFENHFFDIEAKFENDLIFNCPKHGWEPIMQKSGGTYACWKCNIKLPTIEGKREKFNCLNHQQEKGRRGMKKRNVILSVVAGIVIALVSYCLGWLQGVSSDYGPGDSPE